MVPSPLLRTVTVPPVNSAPFSLIKYLPEAYMVSTVALLVESFTFIQL